MSMTEIYQDKLNKLAEAQKLLKMARILINESITLTEFQDGEELSRINLSLNTAAFGTANLSDMIGEDYYWFETNNE